MDHTSENTSFQVRLKEVVYVLYETQLEACYSLETQPSQLYKYFNGKTLPSFLFIERLGRKGVNLNWLLLGRGPMMDPLFIDTSLSTPQNSGNAS